MSEEAVAVETNTPEEAPQEEKKAGHQEVWNIIAAGPSRYDLTEEDLLPGGLTIALNQAIDIRDRLPVQIWSFWDDISKVPDCTKHAYPPMTVWLGPNRALELHLGGIGRVKHPAWEHEFHPEVGFRFMDRGLLPDPIKGGHRAGFTLVYAIEKCAQLGAKHIRVLCCNMSGPWVPGTTTEEASRAANQWNRWAYEKAQLLGLPNKQDPSKSYKGLKAWFKEARGVEVEFHKPAHPSYEPEPPPPPAAA